MSFWTYMLHCADRSFYVGHTDDLEKRVWQHEQGLVPGYTSERLPVKLVWSQELVTREEARAAEARLKGWSRAKKLALIRGDWDHISALARGREDVSGEPTQPAFAAHRFLNPHLDQPPSVPFNLEVEIRSDAGRLQLRFRLTGPVELIRVPPPAQPARRDELWRTTCFETFALLADGPAYLEFNFSPSGEWAAYRFDGHRKGMEPLDVEPPSIRCKRDRYSLEVTAAVSLQGVRPTRLAFSAVIQEAKGHTSYWALAHPAGRPDFHHPESFKLVLPPPHEPDPEHRLG